MDGAGELDHNIRTAGQLADMGQYGLYACVATCYGPVNAFSGQQQNTFYAVCLACL